MLSAVCRCLRQPHFTGSPKEMDDWILGEWFGKWHLSPAPGFSGRTFSRCHQACPQLPQPQGAGGSRALVALMGSKRSSREPRCQPLARCPSVPRPPRTSRRQGGMVGHVPWRGVLRQTSNLVCVFHETALGENHFTAQAQHLGPGVARC